MSLPGSVTQKFEGFNGKFNSAGLAATGTGTNSCARNSLPVRKNTGRDIVPLLWG